jgi:hypothetical protein
MAEKPPSTNNSTPFTKLESSEARNSATVAILVGPKSLYDSLTGFVNRRVLALAMADYVNLSLKWAREARLCADS